MSIPKVDLFSLVADMENRFKSGNSVLVDRASISRKQWDDMLDLLRYYLDENKALQAQVYELVRVANQTRA